MIFGRTEKIHSCPIPFFIISLQILVQLCFSVENFAETLSNLTDKVLDNKAEDGRKSRSKL